MSLHHASKSSREVVKRSERQAPFAQVQKELCFDKAKVVLMLCATDNSYVSVILREIAKNHENVSVRVAGTAEAFLPILEEAKASGKKLFCVTDIQSGYLAHKNMLRLMARHCIEVFAFHWPKYAKHEHTKKKIQRDVGEGHWSYFEKLSLTQAQKAKRGSWESSIKKNLRQVFTNLISEHA